MNPASQLLETVPRVMRAIRREARGAAKNRFTVPQFRILNEIRKSPQTNRELAFWLGVTPPTMSRMIETLEKRKLIIREASQSDLRVQNISLTSRGRREISEIRRIAKANLAMQLSGLSKSQSQALSKGLAILEEIYR